MIAIFLVLMSHATQTVTEPNPYLGYQDYLVDMNRATSSIQQFMLIVLRHAGMQGNAIFFFCSAWYLVDRSKVSAKKIVWMAADVWVVSVVFLIGKLWGEGCALT